MQGNEEGEMEEEIEQPEQEEEIEQHEGSTLQNPLREDELAKMLANMGEYGQPSSPSDLHAKKKPQEENAPEESHAKEAEEENLPIHDEKMIGDT